MTLRLVLDTQYPFSNKPNGKKVSRCLTFTPEALRAWVEVGFFFCLSLKHCVNYIDSSPARNPLVSQDYARII